MFTVTSFTTADKLPAATAFEIRQKVFVEEQKVDAREEYDEHEDESTHYLVYKDDLPVGTARWRFKEGGIKLERFAVLKEHRNSGAGAAVLAEVLKDVIPHGKQIYLNAQVTAVNFYKRAGFEAVGDLFYEANIAHYKMIYGR